MTKIISLLLTCLSVTALAASPSPANTPASSPSPSLSPTPSPSGTQINQEDIEKIRQAVQQKVKEKLAQISTSASGKKGFIGTIAQKQGSTLTIEYQNQTRTLLINEDAVLIDTKRNKTSLDQISPGQAVLAMGQLNQDQVLETKRLIIIEAESLQKRRQIQLGLIADISQSSVFMLIPHNNKDNQYQIKTDSNSQFVTPENKKIPLSQLENGQKVIVVFSPTKANSQTYYAHQITLLSSPTPASDQEPTAAEKPH